MFTVSQQEVSPLPIKTFKKLECMNTYNINFLGHLISRFKGQLSILHSILKIRLILIETIVKVNWDMAKMKLIWKEQQTYY
jgi:hypothetical protein